jgi:hypothetical protein
MPASQPASYAMLLQYVYCYGLAVPCRFVPRQFVPRRFVPCQFVPCRFVPCRAAP